MTLITTEIVITSYSIHYTKLYDIVPESFTHGTSEQRMRWFRRGLDSGDLRQCDTFKAAAL